MAVPHAAIAPMEIFAPSARLITEELNGRAPIDIDVYKNGSDKGGGGGGGEAGGDWGGGDAASGGGDESGGGGEESGGGGD